MAIYIDMADVPDIDNISDAVFKYLITKHKQRVSSLSKNYDYYIGNHDIMKSDKDDEEKVRVYTNYAKYIVDIGTGYYLGEPVKYNNTNITAKRLKKELVSNGVQASIRNGAIEQYDFDNAREIDITALTDAYDNQTISECDAKIGKYLGIFGECYELEYASTDAEPLNDAPFLPYHISIKIPPSLMTRWY